MLYMYCAVVHVGKDSLCSILLKYVYMKNIKAQLDIVIL